MTDLPVYQADIRIVSIQIVLTEFEQFVGHFLKRGSTVYHVVKLCSGP